MHQISGMINIGSTRRARIFFLIVITGCIFLLYSAPAEDTGIEGTLAQRDSQGQLVDLWEIGPGLPPEGWVTDANPPRLDVTSDFISGVPAVDWSYGCSPTSATMLFGYYDRNGYPGLYPGPTNGGIFPLTNAVWGDGECPLTASHKGIDGLTTRGHVDDYYSSFGSSSDPYYGQWTNHTPDSIADFMGTSMYQDWKNTDGSTMFFFLNSENPLHDYTGHEQYGYRDGMHGMRLFAESRGYEVTANYNQYIKGFKGYTNGFTYNQYKAEIDAGYPVLIQVEGHTMAGTGYSGMNDVILHDTWDFSQHTMPWGGSYAGRQHFGVGVFHLATVPPAESPVASFAARPKAGPGPLTVSFSDTSTGLPGSWNWSFGDGSGNSTVKNPVHTYSTPGNYTVNLTVANTLGSNSTSRQDLIRVNMSVNRIIPATGGRGTSIPIEKIKGTGYAEGAKVHLKKAGVKIPMKNVTVVNPMKITGKIPVPAGAATGKWNVVVKNTDGTSARLAKGFTVTG